MKYIYKTLFFLTAVLVLNACKKDTDIFVPDEGQTGPDISWYSNITVSMSVSVLKSNLLLQPFSDTVQVGSNTSHLISSAGLECTFPPNSLVNNAYQPVTGTVNLESLLLKKKGDIIRMGAPTVSNGRLVVSGGEFFIRVSHTGSELQLDPSLRAVLQFQESAVPLQNLKIFNGNASAPLQFNWIPDTDSLNTVVSNNQFYEVRTNQLHWINGGYIYDTSVARVVVDAALPNNYTNANSIVYLVFRDFRSVAGMYGDVANRIFSSNPVPAGNMVTLVVISKQGNDYFMGNQSATTVAAVANAHQKIVVTPVKTTLPNIKQYLDSL